MILVPWNSSFRRRSKVTRRGSFVSPVASAIPHPSGRCYVSDFHTRISAERQLQVTASGKYGLICSDPPSSSLSAGSQGGCQTTLTFLLSSPDQIAVSPDTACWRISAGRPRDSRTHDGTITAERVDRMWGTDLTSV